jgi:thioredoxin reductase
MKNSKKFDVIIIGGSYAGLSAALALGRSMRNVLILDSGLPCNRHTPHSHNFITHDGEKPGVIAEKAKTEILKYSTVKFHHDLAIRGKITEIMPDGKAGGFEIATQTGEEFIAKKLIFATGIKDILPDIKGFSECWGISVVHCPYCHGYEIRNQKTGNMANGERAFHLASLVNNLTDNLTILTSGNAEFNAEQIETLKKHNINIIETEIAEIEHQSGLIKNVIFKNGNKTDFIAVYAALPFEQHSDIPVSLGCELTEQGHIKVDGFKKQQFMAFLPVGIMQI